MFRWFGRNPATVLFATAVVLLIALSAWWYVFLQRAVDNEFTLHAQTVALQAKLHAIDLRAEPELSASPLAKDPRFEVCPASQTPAAGQTIAPVGAYFDGRLLLAQHIRAGWWLCTTPTFRAGVASRRLRRSGMLLGEGLLLSGLLLAVVAMLYRLFRSERRFRGEMEGFLRRVTHEMKTPIAGIKAVLQTIQMGRIPPEQLHDLVGRALVEAEREEHLIQNLLLAQRLRQSGADLRADSLDVTAMVEELVRARAAMSPSIRWTSDIAPNCHVKADPSAVRTVLDNLLDNAAKYGGGAIEIVATVREHLVVVEVSDDGVGFDVSTAADLFEPFVRSSETAAASRGGTGLGLSIAQQLATAMGGAIEAHSDGVGQGARFRLVLPSIEPAKP